MKYPYIFKDQDPASRTFGLWCIRWAESFSEDGFISYEHALETMKRGLA